MKIVRNFVPECTIEQFADGHDLVMHVDESPAGRFPLHRFMAYFEHAETSDGSILSGVYGVGPTEQEAIADYARRISEKRLVIDAYGMYEGRREIDVPRLR